MKKFFFVIDAVIVGLLALYLFYVLGGHDQVAIGLSLVLAILAAYVLSEIR